MEFEDDDINEYMHLMLDVALKSEKFFVIIGRPPASYEEGSPVLYHIEGYPTEDIIGTIEETIHLIPE